MNSPLKAKHSLRYGRKHTENSDCAMLIEKIAEGDGAAFALLYQVTSGLIFGLLLRLLGNTATAEDVLPDVYGEVGQRAAQFDKQHEGPLTWLITIAHRRALERLHSNGLNRQLEDSFKIGDKRDPMTVPDLDITEQQQRIHSALKALSPTEWQIIEMAYFSGMSQRDIASQLGQPLETVKSSLRHGIIKLYGLFKSIDFFPEYQTSPEDL